MTALALEDIPGEKTMTDGETLNASLIELTADIASAYVSNNSVSAGDLPGLIKSIHGALSGADGEPEKPVEIKAPAVSIKKSITDEFLICLEDGRKFKSLKRHLAKLMGLGQGGRNPAGKATKAAATAKATASAPAKTPAPRGRPKKA